MKYGLVVIALLTACADPPQEEAFIGHETPEDFIVLKANVPGIPGVFDRNRIMDDAFFTDADGVTESQVQAFLERTPYNTRCFLADTRVNGRSAAAAIVEGSQAHGISPIVMLARMQVEKSLIAKTQSPGGNSVDYAFGCGCPDNRACNPAFRGLDKQIECAARTLRTHYDGSVSGSGAWVKGRAKRTLDPISITPANHATASLYAYTPWVLQGRGGNWLVWNITLKFGGHFVNLGANPDSGDGAGGAAPPVQPPVVNNAWVGSPCETNAQCGFGGGQSGVCQRFGRFGMCTLSCEGLCPDKAGRGTTFCVGATEFGDDDGGRCTLKAAGSNGNCASIPGMTAKTVARFIGNSRSSAAQANACVPIVPLSPDAELEAPPAAPPAGPPSEGELPPREEAPDACQGLDFLGECRGNTATWCNGGRLLQRDCAADGLVCGYVDQNQGWYCLPGG